RSGPGARLSAWRQRSGTAQRHSAPVASMYSRPFSSLLFAEPSVPSSGSSIAERSLQGLAAQQNCGNWHSALYRLLRHFALWHRLLSAGQREHICIASESSSSLIAGSNFSEGL